MVVSSAEQPRDTYHLGVLFTLPTVDGGQLAVAVSKSLARRLISGYTIIIELILISLWAIITTLVVYYMIRWQKRHSVAASIWNHRASPLHQMGDMISGAKGLNGPALWRLSPLFVVLLGGWAAQIALSIFIAPTISIGTAAPVNNNALYQIQRSEGELNETASLVYAQAPAILRAAGSAQVAAPELLNKISTMTRDLPNEANGERNLEFTYNYNVTGLDFGLKHFSTLELRVQGSCHTTYDWYFNDPDNNDNNSTSEKTIDSYYPFGHSNHTRWPPIEVSKPVDGKTPRAHILFDNDPSSIPPLESGNFTFGMFISSVDRLSDTPGTDPWYRTEKVGHVVEGLGLSAHRVQPGRPALHCWQESMFWFEGVERSVVFSDEIPALPSPIAHIFLDDLHVPNIVYVGLRLGSSLLKSNQGSIGEWFDAEASSIQKDLKWLVLTTYIFTCNIFTDLTLVGDLDERRFANSLLDASGSISAGAGDFVVYTDDVVAMSVSGLIAIPCVMALMVTMAWMLVQATPLKKVKIYDASSLYAKLNPDDIEDRAGEKEAGEKETWTPQTGEIKPGAIMVEGRDMSPGSGTPRIESDPLITRKPVPAPVMGV